MNVPNPMRQFRTLNIKIPAPLFRILKRTAFAKDTSMTKIIVKYLEYLRAQAKGDKELLNEDSEETIKFDEEFY